MISFLKRHLATILKLSITLSALLYLSRIVNLGQLSTMWQALPLWLFALVSVATVLHAWLSGIRWKLLDTARSDTLSNWEYFRYVMIGKFFNTLMPGALGGDFARSVLIFRHVTTDRAEHVTSIFTDRLFGLATILLVGLLSSVITPGLRNRSAYLLLYVIALLLLLLLLALPLLWGPRIAGAFSRRGSLGARVSHMATILLRVGLSLRSSKKNLLWAFGLSMAMHGLSFLTGYLTSYCMGLNLSFLNIVTVSCLVWVFTAVPISISGIGIREISFVYLLGWLGVSSTSATMYSLYMYLFAVIGGVIGLLGLIRRTTHQPSAGCH
ncbi:MAG: flippase-like domain-containing protein [Armatimonadetes bacterium]|nr:flippase-like domain-containing protein [Armatimonadota bacterium]